LAQAIEAVDTGGGMMEKIRIGLCAVLLGGCVMSGQTAAGPAATGPLDGLWGGDRLQLVIEAGVGRVEMDCASGAIHGPIKLAGNGKFLASGTFEQHQGGPQRADQVPAPVNARYSGEVKDDAMKLTIQSDGARVAQEFNLRKGVRVKLVRCL
jgi:hypothetical protein